MKLKTEIKVIWWDLWKTLRTSHCREPVHSLQYILGHRLTTEVAGVSSTGVIDPCDDFLRHCLTTDIADTRQFMQNAAETFGCADVDDSKVELFENVLSSESGCVAEFWDVRPTLKTLSNNSLKLGVISNLWPFPVNHIFESDHGVGKFFPPELRVYSYESGHRKPDPEIFLDALRRVDVRPEECLMVGDNYEADCVGARNVGMQAALIDREGHFKSKALADEDGVNRLENGIIHLKNLTELIPMVT